MHTWQALRPRNPSKMDRVRGSSDSKEEEEKEVEQLRESEGMRGKSGIN